MGSDPTLVLVLMYKMREQRKQGVVGKELKMRNRKLNEQLGLAEMRE